MVRHWSRALPGPALLGVFFASVAAVAAVTPFGDWWAYSLTVLIAVAAAALGVAVEVAACRLHRHWASAGGAALVSVGYYLYLVSAVASAGV